MKFCVISPIKGLERYAKQSRTHLILAQLLYNQEYRAFYTTRRQAGDFLILDNGTYENTRPLDSAQLFNFCQAMVPNVLVLPDILMSPWRKTTSATLHYLDQYADQPTMRDYPTEYMFVPQTTKEDPGGWMKALHQVVNDGRQGHRVTWVGLGRYLARKMDKITMRIDLAKQVKQNYPHLKLHALGMADGSIEELKALRDVGVDSIDSSCAVWRGWNGFALADPEWVEKGTNCDFYADESPITEKLIQSNLEVIFNAIS